MTSFGKYNDHIRSGTVLWSISTIGSCLLGFEGQNQVLKIVSVGVAA